MTFGAQGGVTCPKCFAFLPGATGVDGDRAGLHVCIVPNLTTR